MDKKVLKKRIHKLLFVSVVVVCAILLMAFLFINHADQSLNEATYTTMNQEVSLCKQRISSQMKTDLVLLETLSKSLSSDTDIQTGLNDMDESEFKAIGYVDANKSMVLSNKSTHLEYSDLSSSLQKKIDLALNGTESVLIQKHDSIHDGFVITYTVPVYKNQTIIGALSADSDLKAYSDLMKKSIYGGNLYITDLKDFYSIQKNKESDSVLAVLKDIQLSEKSNGLIGVNGNEHGIVVSNMGISGWYLCYVNSAKSLNHSLYVMSRSTSYVFMLFVLVVMALLWIAYLLMVRSNEEMIDLAYTDQLTGAFSFTRFTQLVSSQAKKNQNYSLVALNIRRFKFMNEVLGRDKADEFLRTIVKCVKPCLKNHEVICRDSADVFYLMLMETQEQKIQTRLKIMFDKIRQETKDFSYEYELCCGVVNNEKPIESYSVEQMLTNVMFALSQSKEMSSENICFFDEEVHEKKEFENFVESNMQEALDSQRFEMVLQPKVDLNTNRVVAAEALVRWKLEDGTYLQPSQFVGIFEKNRFCSKLDFYMLKKAIMQIRTWMDMGIEPVKISVNQSRIVFYDENYIPELKALLEEYQVSGSWITLEVLESTVIEDIDMFNETLSNVKKLGFSVSLDDFGSGYSSLNVLSKLSIDELKIDRIFLYNNSTYENQKTQWILEAIVNFAKKLNIVVVVEGVETSYDDAFIKQLGADIGQGYYYGRPLAISVFNDLITK